MKFTAEHYLLLQSTYLKHFPENFPLDLIKDYRSVLVYKDYLKTAKPDKQLLNTLLDIALEKVNNGQRFQKLTIIKIILNHVKHEELEEPLVQKIFHLYQNLIFTENDEICWKLSVLLKDKKLKPFHIEWLLENWESSEHILNRILRYPQKNKLISQWAETAINNEELSNRKAELIGCILNYRTSFKHKDHKALAMGDLLFQA